MLRYLVNHATNLSQTANTLLGGDPNMTLSARVFVAARRGSVWGRRLERLIDTLFFWQSRHCRGSWAQDVHFAEKVAAIREEIDWPR